MNRLVRLIVFSASPVIRRAFYFDPLLYFAASVLSLSLLLETRLAKATIYYFIFFGGAIITLVSIFEFSRYVKYLPLLFFILFATRKIQYDHKLHRKYSYLIYIFFLLAAVVSIKQNYFGFSGSEIAFLESGIGSIAAEGYLLYEDIRPFSVFSGLAEATLFYMIILLKSIRSKNYFFVILSVILIFISGSRGLMLSFVMSIIWVNCLPNRLAGRYSFTILTIIFSGVSILLILFLPVFLADLQANNPENRLFFYGSMKGRIFYWVEFYNAINIENIIKPVLTEREIYDNIYITLFNDFGFIGMLMITLCVYTIFYEETKSYRIIHSTFISYGIYADQILSVFALCIMLLAKFTLSQSLKKGNK